MVPQTLHNLADLGGAAAENNPPFHLLFKISLPLKGTGTLLHKQGVVTPLIDYH